MRTIGRQCYQSNVLGRWDLGYAGDNRPAGTEYGFGEFRFNGVHLRMGGLEVRGLVALHFIRGDQNVMRGRGAAVRASLNGPAP